jgi:branched-chain amino acid transport system permease protein
MIGKVSFRYGLRGVYFAFVTLTSAEIFGLLALLWKSLTNGAEGILLPWIGHNPLYFSFEVNQKYLYYYIILAMAIGCTLLAHWIKKIRLGYYFAAIRENEEAAETLGIDGPKYKVIAISISAFLTALGGTFYVQYYQHIEPEQAFGVFRTFDMIYPVILGGGGYTLGPAFGAFVLQSLEELTRAIMPPLMHGLHRMVYGILLIVMILHLPEGLMGLVKSGIDRLVLRFKAKRK